MKKKILFVSDDFSPAKTGVGVHLQTLAKGLVERGYEVTVVTTQCKNAHEYEIPGIRIIRTFTLVIAGFPQALPSRSFLKDVVKQFRPNIIHYHYFGLMMVTMMTVAKEFKIPQALTYHFSPDVLTQVWFMKPFRKIINKLVEKTYNKLDLVIAPSLGAYENLKNNLFATKLSYVAQPLDLNSADVAVTSSNQFNVLYVGRLAIEKNIPLLIRAVAIARSQVPSIKLTIIGEGPMSKELTILVKNETLTEHVQFLGFIRHHQLPEHYAKCDVFVLPSVMETLSLVAIESMSFSKPVIVTNKIISAAELVTDGHNGFIVDAFDPNILADRLIILYKNPDLRLKMGLESKSKTDVYHKDNVLDVLEQEYLKVVSKRA